MENIYSHEYVHVIFKVEDLQPLIDPVWGKGLHLHLIDLYRDREYSIIEANSMPDHLHILFQFHITPTYLYDIMETVKAEAKAWIKEHSHSADFSWEKGYSAFTIHYTDIPYYRDFIQNQSEIHQNNTFIDEYRKIIEEGIIIIEEADF